MNVTAWRVILVLVNILGGAVFIGFAVHDFKQKKYYRFGVDIMLTISEIVCMTSIFMGVI